MADGGELARAATARAAVAPSGLTTPGRDTADSMLEASCRVGEKVGNGMSFRGDCMRPLGAVPLFRRPGGGDPTGGMGARAGSLPAANGTAFGEENRRLEDPGDTTRLSKLSTDVRALGTVERSRSGDMGDVRRKSWNGLRLEELGARRGGDRRRLESLSLESLAFRKGFIGGNSGAGSANGMSKGSGSGRLMVPSRYVAMPSRTLPPRPAPGPRGACASGRPSSSLGSRVRRYRGKGGIGSAGDKGSGITNALFTRRSKSASESKGKRSKPAYACLEGLSRGMGAGDRMAPHAGGSESPPDRDGGGIIEKDAPVREEDAPRPLGDATKSSTTRRGRLLDKAPDDAQRLAVEAPGGAFVSPVPLLPWGFRREEGKLEGALRDARPLVAGVEGLRRPCITTSTSSASTLTSSSKLTMLSGGTGNRAADCTSELSMVLLLPGGAPAGGLGANTCVLPMMSCIISASCRGRQRHHSHASRHRQQHRHSNNNNNPPTNQPTARPPLDAVTMGLLVYNMLASKDGSSKIHTCAVDGKGRDPSPPVNCRRANVDALRPPPSV